MLTTEVTLCSRAEIIDMHTGAWCQYHWQPVGRNGIRALLDSLRLHFCKHVRLVTVNNSLVMFHLGLVLQLPRAR
jgi:hypothetical protein